jgi:hypothetical protein
MKKFLALLAALLFVPFAQADETAGTIEADAPRTYESDVRIIPTFGTAAFSPGEVDVDDLGDTTAGGLFIDFGDGWLVGETGILAMSGDIDTADNSASVDVDSWSIPLFAKFNFSGNPHSTVFAKVGAMSYDPGDAGDFNVMGVAGLGGAIPLGKNSAINLDATYNRLFQDDGDLAELQGIALLGGLSFGF